MGVCLLATMYDRTDTDLRPALTSRLDVVGPQVHGPVKTDFGYHLIQVHKRAAIGAALLGV
eukprot:COSAG01_NODE_3843_length_5645_cov_22.311756_4_plen_61_part_00